MRHHTVVDKRATMKKIHLAIKCVDQESVDLPEINNKLKNAVTMKTMQSKPIVYWTKELGRLVKNRNKKRHAITKLTRKKLPTDDLVEQYRELRLEFKKAFRKAKRLQT